MKLNRFAQCACVISECQYSTQDLQFVKL